MIASFGARGHTVRWLSRNVSPQTVNKGKMAKILPLLWDGDDCPYGEVEEDAFVTVKSLKCAVRETVVLEILHGEE